MSPWKVILATIVIFTAGLVAGGVGVRQFVKPARPKEPTLQPRWLREEYVRYMAMELKLTPEQRKNVLKAVHESQERIHILIDLIGPEMEEELRMARESIRAQLTPAQANQFDELVKKRQHRFNELRAPEGQPQEGFRRAPGNGQSPKQRSNQLPSSSGSTESR